METNFHSSLGEAFQKLQQETFLELNQANDSLKNELFNTLKQESENECLGHTDPEIQRVIHELLVPDDALKTSGLTDSSGQSLACDSLTNSVKQLLGTITHKPLLETSFLFLLAPVERPNDLTLQEDAISRQMQMVNFTQIYPGLVSDPTRNPTMEGFVHKLVDLKNNLSTYRHKYAKRSKLACIVFNGHGSPKGLCLRQEPRDIPVDTFLNMVVDVFDLRSREFSHVKNRLDIPHRVRVIMAQCYSHLFKKEPFEMKILDIIPLSSKDVQVTKTELTFKLTQICGSARSTRTVVNSVHLHLNEHAQSQLNRVHRETLSSLDKVLQPEHHLVQLPPVTESTPLVAPPREDVIEPGCVCHCCGCCRVGWRLPFTCLWRTTSANKEENKS